jgi:hypothetical protein
LVTLLVPEVFEATDGFFGLMTNVYDPLDYLVNALGVALAVSADVLAAYVSRWWERRGGEVTQERPREADVA